MRQGADIAVVGGGLVGSSLAYGLAMRGVEVVLFDPDEDDLHASAGNFGLVWVQGKGLGAPAYEALTRRSAAAWSEFGEGLRVVSGIEPAYRQSGGVKVAMSQAELDAQREALKRMHNQCGADDTQMVDATQLREIIPAASPSAAGGVWCPRDGHADPLMTLAALRKALADMAGVTIRRGRVQKITPQSGSFALADETGTVDVSRVVIAAGLGSTALAAPLG
ncbi:MAG: FAD-dependent oxidoreductase, partial [Pseudomonadota bacterium]